MTLATKPNTIEATDLSGGWVTSIEDAAQPDNSLRDVLNLLPQRGSSALVTRRGFTRLTLNPNFPSTHWVNQIMPFDPAEESKLLICILTDGTSNANNVQVWKVDLSTNAATRLDTAGRTWLYPRERHWGIAVGKKWYGGVRGEPMYSWKPTGSVWDPDAAVSPDYKTWVDAVNDGVTLATEYPRDYAWNGKERVVYSSKAFKPRKAIRFEKWDTDVSWYSVGTRVSRKAVWVSTNSYWKSFKCIKGHNPNSANRPGDGTGSWQTYWKLVKFGAPLDEDGDVTPNWRRLNIDVTSAAKSGIAAWHDERLWLRYDGNDMSRVQFSAALKFKEGADIATLVWDPTDWAPSIDDDGSGGGWLDFHENKGVAIRALYPFGQYLIVFQRQHIYVVSGASEETFSIRPLSSHAGTFNAAAVCEYNGMLYFVDEDGLKVTDGTQVEPVPGMEKIRAYWVSRLSDILAEHYATLRDAITCWVQDDYIWVNLPSPNDSTEKYVTLVYDPLTASWWKMTLPVLDTAIMAYQRERHLYFTAGNLGYNESSRPFIYEYGTADTDNNGQIASAAVDIPWKAATAWWAFGALHEQRRIRRMWAIVKGTMTFTIKAFRDWSAAAVKTTARVVSGSGTVHIEGETFADSHAVSYEVSGTKAPAALHSISIDTEPRRRRYHT